MFHQWIISLWRTLVPKVVGGGLGWLALHDIQIADLTEGQIAFGATVFGAGLYYGLARAAEQHWPVLGVLLGSTKQPSYETKTSNE
ncbi:hypothetical protein ACQP1V_42800 (plasmid) [Microtetraspora malaysiensis]|uniref:hypothetical protein n=1 Tax=Microtetraspora malaysiensis TaxID=161358 RepID=UPI003D8F44F0